MLSNKSFSIKLKVILKDLNLIFSNVCSKFQAKLIQFDGEKNHVHLLIEYPPKVAISKILTYSND